MKKVGMFSLVIAVLLFTYTAHATIWYVHPDSTLNSIQAGIGLCSTGDTVLVGAGTYIENINFNGMAITVMSEYGPDTTIIDGSNPSHPDTGSVVLFLSGEDTTSILEGFTLTNGSGTYDPTWGDLGGGILCVNSSPTIDNNTIIGNTAAFGGGIDCSYGSSPSIINNRISACTTSASGAGIDLYDNCSPTIMNNTITDNTAGAASGGIQCFDYCSPLIINNTITDNTANNWGGGIRVSQYSASTIKGNYIGGNEASDGGGIECDGNGCAPHITGNMITLNTAYQYGGGIDCDMNAVPTIDSCTISDNTGDGVFCRGSANPVLQYNDIIGNIAYGVCNIYANVTVNAEYNWWGDPSGPGGSGPGSGDPVSAYVDYDPWLTSPGVEAIEIIEPLILYLQVNPNPFRDKVSITFSMEYDIEAMAFTIYDATGRVVKEFNNLTNNHVFWNGTDNVNRRLPSGVYFLKVTARDYNATKKLLLIR